MTTPAEHDQLLAQLARRNWVILALLTLASLPWQDRGVTLGVASGGMVAIVGYRWLERSLRSVLTQQEHGAARRFQFGYILRLATIGLLLYVLVARLQVQPVALAIGLSVVVINILYTTVRRLI